MFDGDWVEEIKTHGYTIVRQLIPAAEVTHLRETVERELARHGKADTSVGTVKAKEVTQLLFTSVRTSRLVRDMFFDPRTQWILGCFHEKPVIEHTKVLIKSAHAPATPWHQDHAFFHKFDPSATMLTMWSPLHAVSPENGGLRILAGEPPRSLLPHTEAPGREKLVEPGLLAPLVERGIVHPPVEPGDVVCFTSRVVHGTSANQTAHDRLAFKLVYQDLTRRSRDQPLRASRAVSFHGVGALNRMVPCALTRLQIQRAQLRAELKQRFA